MRCARSPSSLPSAMRWPTAVNRLTAARSIESLGRNVAEIGRERGLAGLEAIPGVGASIAAKVNELLATGSLTQLEELRQEIPAELTALLEIPGLGPQRLRLLHQRCGVRSLADLERVAKRAIVRDRLERHATPHAAIMVCGELSQLPEVLRQELEKGAQPVEVEAQAGGELPQNGAEFFAQAEQA